MQNLSPTGNFLPKKTLYKPTTISHPGYDDMEKLDMEINDGDDEGEQDEKVDGQKDDEEEEENAIEQEEQKDHHLPDDRSDDSSGSDSTVASKKANHQTKDDAKDEQQEEQKEEEEEEEDEELKDDSDDSSDSDYHVESKKTGKSVSKKCRPFTNGLDMDTVTQNFHYIDVEDERKKKLQVMILNELLICTTIPSGCTHFKKLICGSGLVCQESLVGREIDTEVRNIIKETRFE